MFSITVISIFGLHTLFTQTHPSLRPLVHLFRVLVHGFDEGAHVLRVHVRVKAMTQVGDVAPGAKTLHHLLHDV